MMTETAQLTEPESHNTRVDDFWELVRSLMFAALIALTVRTFAYEPFNIPSGSMEPTLHVGDYLFVSKYSYGYGSRGTFWGFVDFDGRWGGNQPKRGDIVVFKLPSDNKTDYIKRLIGLPGDTVQMRQGILYINGVAVERHRLPELVYKAIPSSPYVADYTEDLPNGVHHVIRKYGDENPLDNTEIFVVPAGHYFFMGDNRDNSRDSRDPTSGVGFVPEKNLVGRADLIFFSKDTGWDIRWDRIFKRIIP